MQILQVHYDDYVPRYQIFMFDDSKIYKSIQQWQEPTTIWDGKPVLEFMTEMFLDDLPVIGFKDFHPMWTWPTTSVNQCWEPMTFGMAPWHLCENVDKQKSKEALQSQSPIAAFKACNMIQALGNAYSKIVLPSSDSKGETKGSRLKGEPTAPLHGPFPINGNMHRKMLIYCDRLRQVRFYAKNVHF